MPDLPGGQPPRIVGPISGPARVLPSGDGGGRRGGGQDQAQHPPYAPAGAPPATAAPTVETGPPPVPDPLVQALDRLRATNELRPVDAEMARLLRGMREYAGATPPHGLPVLPAEDPPADPG